MLSGPEVESALNTKAQRILPGSVFKGVSIDSRTVNAGELFVCIRGPKFDGHEFVSEAFSKGAAGFVTCRSDERWKQNADLNNVFEVDDTAVSLGILANAYRKKLSVRSLAVTGSCGKTTTKEICHRVLSAKYSVHATQGNLNNQYGLPLTILRMPESSGVLLAEMGANHPGDIEYLCGIAEPVVGLITNVYPAHLEGFGSLDGVYRAKLELAAACQKKSGILIVNGDNEELVRRAGEYKVKLVTFGHNPKNEYRAEKIDRDREGFRFTVRGQEFYARTQALFNIDNFLAAIAMGSVLGISVEEMRGKLEAFQEVTGRFEMKALGKGVSVVYDAYNANPGSVLKSLESFSRLRSGAKRMIAVLGDMKELGPGSRDFHRGIGETLDVFSLNTLVAVGEHAREIAEGAREKGACESIHYFPTNAEACSFLSGFVEEGDYLLLKGSRSMKLEEILQGLSLKLL